MDACSLHTPKKDRISNIHFSHLFSRQLHKGITNNFSATRCMNHHFTVTGIAFKHKVIHMVKNCNPAGCKPAVSHGYIFVVIIFLFGKLNLPEESDTWTAVGIGEAAVFYEKIIDGA